MNEPAVLQPVYCDGVGGFLPYVAHFCAKNTFPDTLFNLKKAIHPEAVDTFAWFSNIENPHSQLTIHPDVEVIPNVRSVVNRDFTRVTLLVNKRFGSFLELRLNDKSLEPLDLTLLKSSVVSADVRLSSIYMFMVALLRHNILSTQQTLYLNTPSSIYLLGSFVHLYQLSDGTLLLCNKLSGIACKISGDGFCLPKGPIDSSNLSTDIRALLEKLCRYGMYKKLCNDDSTRHGH